MPERVTLQVNGQPVSVPAGATVAAAVLIAGETGEPLAPLCGMGVCFECRVTIDGAPHIRSCRTLCRPGMEVITGLGSGAGSQPAVSALEPRPSLRFDILIIGAGPAGIAAACAAAGSGRRVAVIDDNTAAGGQIWRGETAGREPAAWFERLRKAGVKLLTKTTVIDRPAACVLLCESDEQALEIAYDKIVLATGARERVLPFPGWTLPNVMGAGGLQALVKSGLPVAGKRVVVAGTGPLLLAVAAYLRKCGAEVRAVAEQAPWRRIAEFGLSLAGEPAKLTQALSLKWKLRGVPYVTSCHVVSVEGAAKVERVVLTSPGRTWTEPCDYLACGFGLVPNVELALLLGCDLDGGFVAVNEWQETSVSGVYCAGEPVGIGGAGLALAAGEIAGYAAAGSPAKARLLFGARSRAIRFMKAMDQAFALRDDLKRLATPDTIVCRCEDVPLGRIAALDSWKSAKLQTRCGMGPCQGRVCGSAVEFLLGWTRESTRPPVYPATLGHLSGASINR